MGHVEIRPGAKRLSLFGEGSTSVGSQILKLRVEDSPKAQSAMEYLMTYGWAILIIAVVLGALFGLGFFNAANLAPKVTAGSCQVQRPEGPGTASYINLEGTCNNELPQYVLSLSEAGNILVPMTLNNNPITVGVWIYPECHSAFQFCVVIHGGNSIVGLTNVISSDIVTAQVNSGTFITVQPSTVVYNNTWDYLAYTYDGSELKAYVNGVMVGEQAGTIANSESSTVIFGSSVLDQYQYYGYVSDIQIYNSSLSANEIQALYQEGIGGVPINLQNLVGWWPLNGNANDYSGDLNNGVASEGVFTSSWTNGYSAP